MAYGYDVTADATGKVTVVGAFQGTVDFGGGALYTGMNGVELRLLRVRRRVLTHRSYIAAKRYGSGVNAQAKAVTNGVGGAVVAGFFTDTVDFGFGPVTSAGFTDVFILNSGRSSRAGYSCQCGKKFGNWAGR